jgi:Na+/H+-dicarboxylate symporter
MLQVIFFAVLFGLSITLIGKNGKAIGDFFVNINEVIMKMVTILMSFAPIGVFCVVAKVFGEKGLDPVQDLLAYFLVMVFVLLLHMFGTYGSMVKFIGRLSPFRFFENIRPAAMMAFSTASSNATIPVTLETVEKRMGVNNSVASFTVPLGATINMDGTAIMQGVATVFIANAFGIDLTFNQYLMVILTATFASVGTAGVPGVGMITLAMVLQQVGLPEQGILLLLPVDRILDMCRTSVNICGDAAVTCIVAKTEGQFDQKVYDEPLGEHYGEYHFPEKKK